MKNAVYFADAVYAYIWLASVLHPINVKKINQSDWILWLYIINMIPTKTIFGLKQNCLKGHIFIISIYCAMIYR